jgi:lysophospholipase L1-like esterase
MDIQILDLAPSKVFINIGTNDMGFGVPEETFLGNYDAILTQIQEKLPEAEVFAMAYYPINKIADKGEPEVEHNRLMSNRSNEALAIAGEKIEKLAHKHGYQFINVNAGLADDDGNLKPEYTFDGAHMLPAGYEVVLENMKKYL